MADAAPLPPSVAGANGSAEDMELDVPPTPAELVPAAVEEKVAEQQPEKDRDDLKHRRGRLQSCVIIGLWHGLPW